MNRQNALLIGAAIFIGLIAVYLANAYFSGIETQQAEVIKQARLTRIAVATQPIDFGAPLTNTNVAMADWPAGSVPAGSFAKIEDALNNRVALRPMIAGEPILAARVTGTDGRATIAANLPKDKLAVAVPITDVSGVAGFVRPGDAVDILLTRQMPGEGAGTSDKMTDVLMEAVPVLAIDQVADSSKTDPTVAKTATLQVDTYGAQRLALARELGTLSLALRNVASQPLGNTYRTVTQRDLTSGRFFVRPTRVAVAAPAPAPRAPAPRPQLAQQAPPAPIRYRGPSMTIYRKAAPTNYEINNGL